MPGFSPTSDDLKTFSWERVPVLSITNPITHQEISFNSCNNHTDMNSDSHAYINIDDFSCIDVMIF